VTLTEWQAHSGITLASTVAHSSDTNNSILYSGGSDNCVKVGLLSPSWVCFDAVSIQFSYGALPVKQELLLRLASMDYKVELLKDLPFEPYLTECIRHYVPASETVCCV